MEFTSSSPLLDSISTSPPPPPPPPPPLTIPNSSSSNLTGNSTALGLLSDSISQSQLHFTPAAATITTATCASDTIASSTAAATTTATTTTATCASDTIASTTTSATRASDTIASTTTSATRASDTITSTTTAATTTATRASDTITSTTTAATTTATRASDTIASTTTSATRASDTIASTSAVATTTITAACASDTVASTATAATTTATRASDTIAGTITNTCASDTIASTATATTPCASVAGGGVATTIATCASDTIASITTAATTTTTCASTSATAATTTATCASDTIASTTTAATATPCASSASGGGAASVLAIATSITSASDTIATATTVVATTAPGTSDTTATFPGVSNTVIASFGAGASVASTITTTPETMSEKQLPKFTIPKAWETIPRWDDNLNLSGAKPAYAPEFNKFTFEEAVPENYDAAAGEDGEPNAQWIKDLVHKNGVVQLEDHFGIKAKDGFWVVAPAPEDRVCFPPTDIEGNVYTAVYLHQLAYGLRFPVHYFLQAIMCEYKVCFAQITPQSLRRLLGFIWLCEFFEYPLTMNLFKACFRIRVASKMRGWFKFENVKGTSTSYPKINDLRDWKHFFVFVRVPTAIGHDNRFCAPTNFTKHHDPGVLQENCLSPWELAALKFFQKTNDGWLPYYEYMARDEVLALGNLSQKISQEAALKMVNWFYLGITPCKTRMKRVSKPLSAELVVPFKVGDPTSDSRGKMGHYVDPFDNKSRVDVIRTKPKISASFVSPQQTLETSFEKAYEVEKHKKKHNYVSKKRPLEEDSKKRDEGQAAKKRTKIHHDMLKDVGQPSIQGNAFSTKRPLLSEECPQQKDSSIAPLSSLPPGFATNSSLATIKAHMARMVEAKKRVLQKGTRECDISGSEQEKSEASKSGDPVDQGFSVGDIFSTSDEDDEEERHAITNCRSKIVAFEGRDDSADFQTNMQSLDTIIERISSKNFDPSEFAGGSATGTSNQSCVGTFSGLGSNRLVKTSLTRDQIGETTPDSVPDEIKQYLVKWLSPTTGETSTSAVTEVSRSLHLLKVISDVSSFIAHDLQKSLDQTCQESRKKDAEIYALKKEKQALAAREKQVSLEKITLDNRVEDLETKMGKMEAASVKKTQKIASLESSNENLRAKLAKLTQELEQSRKDWVEERAKLAADHVSAMASAAAKFNKDKEKINVNLQMEFDETIAQAFAAAEVPIRRCFFQAYPNLEWLPIYNLLKNGKGEVPHPKDDDWIDYMAMQELEEEKRKGLESSSGP